MKIAFGVNTYEKDGVIYVLPTVRYWRWNGCSVGLDVTWVTMSLHVSLAKGE